MFDGNLRSAVDKILDPVGRPIPLKLPGPPLAVTGILILLARAIVIGAICSLDSFFQQEYQMH